MLTVENQPINPKPLTGRRTNAYLQWLEEILWIERNEVIPLQHKQISPQILARDGMVGIQETCMSYTWWNWPFWERKLLSLMTFLARNWFCVTRFKSLLPQLSLRSKLWLNASLFLSLDFFICKTWIIKSTRQNCFEMQWYNTNGSI